MCEGHKFEGDKSETNSKEGQKCVRVTSFEGDKSETNSKEGQQCVRVTILKEIKVKRTARKDNNV